jgi:NADPH2:quinone reductase
MRALMATGGQRVTGHAEMGGWAQYAAIAPGSLAVLPDSISAIQAAALPLAGLTALRLLRVAGNITGQRILLTGASGGVGHHASAGRLHPEIGRVADWADTAAALNDLGQRRIRGNAVLTVS